jgi:electron transfer flavoprotein alpha/beta subunit
MLEYKLASTHLEYPNLLEKWPEFGSEDALDRYLAERGQRIVVWSGADIGADYSRVGLSGSPTKVFNVNFVQLGSSGSQEISADEEGIAGLIEELVEDYIL